MNARLHPAELVVESMAAVGPGEPGELAAFLARCAPDDGAALGEQQLLALRSGGEPRPVGVFVRDGQGRLVGYGQLLRSGEAWLGDAVLPAGAPGANSAPSGRNEATAEGDGAAAAGPGSGDAHGERAEVAAAVLDGLVAAARDAGGGHLAVWLRAAGPADDAVVLHAGLALERRLLQLRRTLPVEGSGEGATTRPFRVGVDEEAFLAVNRRAFAALPDQAGMTLESLSARERQPWFDPQGFLIYEEDGRLTAFCWTKLHRQSPPEGSSASVGAPALGEIYVIGVDPAAQGHGLGRAMLLAGCGALYAAGADEVMLYVDSANLAGRHLYDATGFHQHHEDRCYGADLLPASP